MDHELYLMLLEIINRLDRIENTNNKTDTQEEPELRIKPRKRDE